MKFKWTDWLTLVAFVIAWVSVAVGNRSWQSWAFAALLSVAVCLTVSAEYLRHSKAVRRGGDV
jgi:hypothetical protein